MGVGDCPRGVCLFVPHPQGQPRVYNSSGPCRRVSLLVTLLRDPLVPSARDVQDRVWSYFCRSRNGRPGDEDAFRGGFLGAVFIERADRGRLSRRRRRILCKDTGREDEGQTDCEGCSEKSELRQSDFVHNVPSVAGELQNAFATDKLFRKYFARAPNESPLPRQDAG